MTMMMEHTTHPRHLLTQKRQNHIRTKQQKEAQISFFASPVATMINFKTKPFPKIQPIPAAESQRGNNNEIFDQLHLTQHKIKTNLLPLFWEHRTSRKRC
jgi:hypothetical protein